MSGETTIQKRVQLLITKHGTLRAASRAINVDAAYLHRLASGEKHNPSPVTLKRLGLRKVISVKYYRL